MKLCRHGLLIQNSFRRRPILHVVEHIMNLNWLDREAKVEENRNERGPTAFADLERLREELNELGLRIRRPAGEQSQQERREEGANTLVLRAK